MMPIDGVRVLVTGGAGFIGSHLVESLVEAGGRVTVLDSLRDSSAANLASVAGRACLVEGDVRSPEQVRATVAKCRPQIVFHLAANASVPGSVDDPAHDFETNAVGTFVLLDALRQAGGCERVVIASSGAVYGQPKQFPIVEEDRREPISPYGASKVSAEVTGQVFWRVYGLPVVIARLFNAYGPRMARFVVLDFLRKLDANPDVLEILGDGTQVRDFTYVADTVQGLELLAERGALGKAYNVSSGTSCSVTELAHCLLDVMGLSGCTRIQYTGVSWKGDAHRWVVSIDRLVELGYQSHTSLGEGLKRTVHWFSSQQRSLKTQFNVRGRAGNK